MKTIMSSSGDLRAAAAWLIYAEVQRRTSEGAWIEAHTHRVAHPSCRPTERSLCELWQLNVVYPLAVLKHALFASTQLASLGQAKRRDIVSASPYQGYEIILRTSWKDNLLTDHMTRFGGRRKEHPHCQPVHMQTAPGSPTCHENGISEHHSHTSFVAVFQ